MPIELGQIYRSCDPRGGSPIRIDAYTSGHDHAYVVDAITGKRPRWILVAQLHATATTCNGKPRRTGYALDTGSPR
ncbi:hypothetical protein DT019_03150 [Streptomyces sp. SDr-06]|uniref:hypothetical protein n=1 Tax=Streptomyces sp. SDr-06 TaxID=2267702 RepID=UPI000DE9D596|nr:hypothetical protein [Streptomyces sp. SDr-06]RCH70501.1 hypothetical protein DT019_03150 [Streptomyces sp. SDr-06]